MGPSRGITSCARRSPVKPPKDAGSIPATSTPRRPLSAESADGGRFVCWPRGRAPRARVPAGGGWGGGPFSDCAGRAGRRPGGGSFSDCAGRAGRRRGGWFLFGLCRRAGRRRGGWFLFGLRRPGRSSPRAGRGRTSPRGWFFFPIAPAASSVAAGSGPRSHHAGRRPGTRGGGAFLRSRWADFRGGRCQDCCVSVVGVVGRDAELNSVYGFLDRAADRPTALVL